jgi:CheY-like chemotaxis protein
VLDAGATLPHAAGSVRWRMALTLDLDPLLAERCPSAGRPWALDLRRPPGDALLVPREPIVTINGHAGERMRILVIEDNVKLAQAIKASLEQHGYSIDVARTAKEGDEIALVEHHDLIILDVMLPDGDGVELCGRLRRQKITTPILMLTVLGATTDKVAGLDAGADDYLTKPFQLDELLARLRSLLRRSQALEGSMLQSGIWSWICTSIRSRSPAPPSNCRRRSSHCSNS